MNLKNQILRSTLVLVIISLVAKVLGYGEKLVLAYYWGTGQESDSYTIVLGLVMSVFFLCRELVEPGFLSTFMRSKEEGAGEAGKSLFNTVGAVIVGFTGLIALAAMVFPEVVVKIFAPGFEAESLDTATIILRVAAPGIVFLALSSLTYITLNAMKRFFLPALGDLAFKVLIILCLVLLHAQLGVVAMGIAILAGTMGRLLVHLLPLRKYISWSTISFRSKAMHRMALLSAPIALGVVFSMASGLIDNALASTLEEGAVSALSYAKKTIEMPIVVLPYALGVVAFPYFSQLALEKKTSRLAALFGSTSKLILFLFLPLAVLTFALAPEIIQVLFERGAFDTASTALTVAPLKIYAFGMVAFAIETILVLLYFSVGDTRTPIFWGIIGVIVNICLTYILINFEGYEGIAWATVVSKTLKVCVLMLLLRRHFSFDMLTVRNNGLRLIAATGTMAFFILGLFQFWKPGLDSMLKKLLYIGGVSFASLVVFVAVALLTGFRITLPKDQ